MQTVATGIVLSAAKDKDDPGAAARIARFVDTLFPRFAELQASDPAPEMARGQSHRLRSPASAGRRKQDPGSRNVRITAEPIAASAGVVAKAALPQNLVMSLDQKEALFKQIHRMAAHSEN